MRVFVLAVCFFVFSILTGCAQDSQDLEDPVLAEVGDSRITASQLLDFERRLPEELKTKKTGVAGYRDYLQTIIDKEIYLQEAVKRGLDKIPEVAQKLRREREDRLMRLVFQREFIERVEVDEGEIKTAYESAPKESEIKLRLIIVDTQSEAEEILQSIRAGRDFAELAHEHSLHQDTAQKGGELDGYLTNNRIPVYLQTHIAALEVGEYSEPIRLPNKQFGIYQVMHARTVSFAAMSNALAEQLTEQKTTVLVETRMAELKNAIDLQPQADNLAQLIEWIEAGRREFSAEERDMALYEFTGGQVSIGDFWDYAADLDMGFSGDIAASVQWFAQEVLLFRTLLLLLASETGVDQDEQIVRWEERRKTSLLLLALRQTAVKDQIDISPEEVRKFYDSRPDLFTPPEEVVVQEIMVKTQEEAAALKSRLEAGEEMGALAEEYTLRAVAKGAEGKFHIHPFEQAFYKELIDATRQAETGALYGPLAVTVQAAQVDDPQSVHPSGEYYSIFKVIESNFGTSPDPFEKVERRAKALLKRAAESRLSGQFMAQLHQSYQDRVVIHEEQLKTLLPQ